MRFVNNFNLLEKFLSFIILKVNIIASIALGIMVLITFIDVNLRIFFNRPIKGAYELTEFLMVIVVFFAIAYTSHLKGHIIIEIISSKLPQKFKKIFDSISYIINFSFLILIAWEGIIQAEISKLKNDIGGVTGIPIFPFYCILVFGVILTSLVFLSDFISSFNRCVKK